MCMLTTLSLLGALLAPRDERWPNTFAGVLWGCFDDAWAGCRAAHARKLRRAARARALAASPAAGGAAGAADDAGAAAVPKGGGGPAQRRRVLVHVEALGGPAALRRLQPGAAGRHL
jgi:hypothetical protein